MIAEYKTFLDRYLDSIEITTQIQTMRDQGRFRFPINLDQLRQVSKQQYPKLVDDLIRAPTELVKSLQTKLQSICQLMAQDQDDGTKKNTYLDKNYKIYFEGKIGRNFVTPRGLKAEQVNQLVQIQGIVTKMSLIQQKLLTSVQYVEKTNKFKISEFFNNLDASEITTNKQMRIPQKKDEEGNPMLMEFGLSQFRDYQTVIIQEVPERTPTGLLPRSIEVTIDQDLVDKAKPGDRVTIQGVFKCFPNATTMLSGAMRTVLIALDIKPMRIEHETKISEQDVKQIEKISKTPKLLEFMSKSIAPSIYGHDFIKQSVLLQLLGGREKNLETGTHLRGDVNILLIGDPSTAKSQLLRYVMGVAPLAINTTGRGTSSVGLTAAVKRDDETGDNTLEAGAMVLADGGMILIDEFDKMNEVDRVAIHEVMEQQTVTIAKAGIHCSLNARCSVLAAANPLYGEYQQDLPPTRNIGLPDSLLSRFDLIFIVLDQKSRDLDMRVAERVTRNHRYKGVSSEEQNFGDIIQPLQDMNIKQETSPFVQSSNLYNLREQKNMLTQNFLKKYIQYAKENFGNVEFTDEANEEVTKQWVKLREVEKQDKQIRTQPITIRSLESMIRLATAHAKLRLSRTIDLQDVKIATNIMRTSLWYDVEEEEEEEEAQVSKKQRSQRESGQKHEQTPMKQELKQEEPALQVRSDKKKKLQEQEGEAEFHMELQQASQESVTKDQKKTVFKIIAEFKNKQKIDEVDIDLIWGQLQQQARPIITNYRVFLKCILDLGDKLHFDLQKRTVQLL